MDEAQRRALGAWYTPATVVAHVLDTVLDPVLRERHTVGDLRVLDPACGDGRFLVAAAERIRTRYGVDPNRHLFGVDIDPEAVAATNRSLGARRAIQGDGLRFVPDAVFDVVIGNPPFLGQLRTRTTRSTPGHGYADTAALFLDRSIELARPDGGRVGLVLPQSILATRDVAPIRASVLDRARLDALWFAGQPVFADSDVHVIAAAFVRGRNNGQGVRRSSGLSFAPAVTRALAAGEPWSTLVADLVGVPVLDVPNATRLASIASATADFRDQYYGLVGAVTDHGDGPPLITSGLIDPGVNGWGTRRARFAGRHYRAPRVELALLDDSMRSWAAKRLVPKVLVATQTTVLEWVLDERGAWLPSVPVITVTGADLWSIAAVLSSPVASAWLAARSLGTGLTATALRPTASLLLTVPLPTGSLERAVARLRAGDLAGAARASLAAYGVDDPALYDWWHSKIERITRR